MLDLDALRLTTLRDAKDRDRLCVSAQSWGYSIRSGQMPPFSVLAAQLLSFFLGVSFVTASLGLLTLPGTYAASDLDAMRIGAAGLFVAGAAYLLWFASRGSRVEVRVDTDKREILEVIDNRAGRPTILSRYDFDDIGGVYLETGAGAGPTQLVLSHRGSMVLIATGNSDQLTVLRDQISRDILGPVSLNLAARPDATRSSVGRQQNRAA